MKPGVLNLGSRAVIMCAAAASCAAFAQEAEYVDLYYNADYNISGWGDSRYMQNPAVWNVGSQGGSVFDGEVNSAYNNLFFISSEPLTSNQSIVFGYDSYDWNVHNITVDFTVDTNYRILQVVEGQKLRVWGDISASLKSFASWWAPQNSISLGANSSIAVDGNMSVANSTSKADVDANSRGQNGLHFSVSSENYMPSSFEVKGNVAFKSEDTHSYWSDNILFSLGVTSFKVGGYVDMTETRAGTFTWDLCKTANDNYFSDISVGGLEGGSALQISSAHSATVNLTFANSSAHSYSGTLASRAGSDNKLNVTMDASDAQNGRQTLIIKEGGAVEGDAAMNPSRLDSVTVLNGTLNLGAYNGLVNGDLYLGGANGRLEISSVDGGAGTLAFENATFERGTIVFTIEETAADKIEITGDLGKFGNGKIGVEFDADPYDIGEWILAGGGDSIEYELISFGSGSVAEDDFVLGDLGGGIFANLFIRDNALYVEFTNVPEPAAFAAMLGLLALLFAARRRGKRSFR